MKGRKLRMKGHKLSPKCTEVIPEHQEIYQKDGHPGTTVESVLNS